MKTRTLKTFLYILPLLFAVSCHKDSEPSPGPNSWKYQRIVDKFLQAGATGVSVTVISPQGTWTGAGGKADVQGNTVLKPENTLRIGSMTKLFAMATILKLQEEKVLNIKDKISKYIPASITGRIANGNDITIEQCLNHTSGVAEYLTEDVFVGIMNGTISRFSAERNLQFIYDKPAYATPGKGSKYCNSNYLLLSSVISHATGKPAYDVVREKIITPLNLKNTFPGTATPTTLTKAYYSEAENGSNAADVTALDNAAVGGEGALDGGMIATSEDIAHFLEALLTGKVLSAGSLAQIQTFQPINPEDLTEDLLYYKGYGLGLMKIETNKGTALGHDGHVHGFVGKAFYLPSQKVTMVILLNSWSPAAVKVLNAKETFDLLF